MDWQEFKHLKLTVQLILSLRCNAASLAFSQGRMPITELKGYTHRGMRRGAHSPSPKLLKGYTMQTSPRNPKVGIHVELLKCFELLDGAARTALQAELDNVTLLTPGAANTKIAKGEGRGYLSYILHLAPSALSGYNVCPAASKGCIAACLNTAGRGRFTDTQTSRIRKTLYYIKLQPVFLSHLWSELDAVQRKADKLGLKAVVRLNGTSDISWELRLHNGANVFDAFPRIQFYDYTKVISRLTTVKGIANYNLTFSASEANDKDWNIALSLGYNVAVVFDKTPKLYNGIKVIDGDADDLRFTDKRGVIVGLKAKGKAKLDKTGFVKVMGAVKGAVKQAA